MAYLKKRKNIYYIIKKEKGIVVYNKSTQKRSIIDAREELKNFIKNEESLIVKIKAISLLEFSKEYIALNITTMSNKTLQTVKASFNEFVKIAGNKLLTAYTVRDIDKFLQYECSLGKHQTAARIKRTLKPAFKLAVKWNYLRKNPFEESIKIKLPETEITFITKEEYKAIINSTEGVLKDIIIWASHTGMRQGEIINMKTSQVNIKKKIITVLSTKEHRTKSGKSRFIELHDLLIPIYNKYKEQEYLFINPITNNKYSPKTLSEKFKYIIRKLKLNDNICFHSLRSSYGMWLLPHCNLKWISQQLGHSSIAVTERNYVKFITTENTGEVNKINF